MYEVQQSGVEIVFFLHTEYLGWPLIIGISMSSFEIALIAYLLIFGVYLFIYLCFRVTNSRSWSAERDGMNMGRCGSKEWGSREWGDSQDSDSREWGSQEFGHGGGGGGGGKRGHGQKNRSNKKKNSDRSRWEKNASSSGSFGFAQNCNAFQDDIYTFI